MHLQIRLFKKRFPRYQRIRWDRRLVSLGPFHLHEITHEYPSNSRSTEVNRSKGSAFLIGAIVLGVGVFGWLIAGG